MNSKILPWLCIGNTLSDPSSSRGHQHCIVVLVGARICRGLAMPFVPVAVHDSGPRVASRASALVVVSLDCCHGHDCPLLLAVTIDVDARCFSVAVSPSSSLSALVPIVLALAASSSSALMIVVVVGYGAQDNADIIVSRYMGVGMTRAPGGVFTCAQICAEFASPYKY